MAHFITQRCADDGLPGEQLIDWGGALRWLKSTAEDNQIHRIARNAGGHATRFSAGDGGFAPLSAPLFRYHQQLKTAARPLRRV